jgi:TPR repeat protein
MRALRRVCKSLDVLCPGAVDAAVKLGRAEEAFGWAKAMCEFDELTCYSVADLYAEGKGTKKDPAKAKAAWRKSCQDGAGIKSSCDKIGLKAK